MAYMGWWYYKQDLDSTGTLWILNDGKLGSNGQIGIELQQQQFRALKLVK